MRILVNGKKSQLGQSINKLINVEAKMNIRINTNGFIFVGKGELDLSSQSNINHYFDNNDKFDIIINCAAYTAVDKAEKQQALANQVNHLAVKQLAKIAKKQKAKLIHISTDYIFDGTGVNPYKETDKANPINIYGKTKLDGEKALQEIMPTDAIIIRTSWVYSEFGNNFVKTMLRLGKERDELNVVNDQIGSPTYATDLAYVILIILNNKEFREEVQASQIYHYSNAGNISWYDFAKELFKLAKIDCNVNPITTEQYPTPAKRPLNSKLNKKKIYQAFEINSRYWKNSLTQAFQLIMK